MSVTFSAKSKLRGMENHGPISVEATIQRVMLNGGTHES
jgi:hypothetical protein